MAVKVGDEEASVLSTDDRRTVLLSVDQLGGDTIAGAGTRGCDPSLLEHGSWLCRCSLKCVGGFDDVRHTFGDEKMIAGIFSSLKRPELKVVQTDRYTFTGSW